MQHLQSGKKLRQYKILGVLGSGGFSVVYLALDESLNKLFAIKEYFPQRFAHRHGAAVRANRDRLDDFNWGKRRFIQEAQNLARFDRDDIVKVIQIFETNNTAYMVLEHLDGRDITAWLAEIDTAPTQNELDQILESVFSALEAVHRNELLHRDLSPDNIFVRNNGSLALLDFGSAKEAIGQRTRLFSAVVKDGYSPIEQYSALGSGQGPWTDIYALAATLYRAVTGDRPPAAPDRFLEDTFVPTKVAAKGVYRPSFLDAIDWGLRLAANDRPQSIGEWRSALFNANNLRGDYSSEISSSRDPSSTNEGPVIPINAIEASRVAPVRPKTSALVTTLDEVSSAEAVEIDEARVAPSARPETSAFVFTDGVSSGEATKTNAAEMSVPPERLVPAVGGNDIPVAAPPKRFPMEPVMLICAALVVVGGIGLALQLRQESSSFQQARGDISRSNPASAREDVSSPRHNGIEWASKEALCRSALNGPRTNWDQGASYRAAVEEAIRRRYDVADCRQILGMTNAEASQNAYHETPPNDLCRLALSGDGSAWDSNPAYQPEIEEARHRNYSVADCRRYRAWPESATAPPRPSAGSQTTAAINKFTTQPNRDIYGHDLFEPGGQVGVHVWDLDECAQRCADTDQCVAFSFDRWTSTCYQKNSVADSVLDAHSTIAVKWPLDLPHTSTVQAKWEIAHQRRFRGTMSATTRVAAFMSCRTSCDDKVGCVGFTFMKGAADNCRLYSAVEGYEHDDASESASKYQPPS